MVQLDTKILQERLKVLSLGAGRNPLRPMTQLLFLKTSNSFLTLMTTDMINTLYTSFSCNGELEIAVEIDLFLKLIQSLKDETITIEVRDNLLIIQGKGKYTIPAVYNGIGEVIKYKDKRKIFEGKLLQNDFPYIYKSLTISKADATFPVECYRNFYFGENILTSNIVTASVLNQNIFNNKLYFDSTIKILSAFGNEIYYEDNHFKDKEYYLITNENANIEDYQFEEILELLKDKRYVEIEIEVLKEILNRFTIFKYETLMIVNDEIQSEKRDIIEPFENGFNETISLDVKLLKKYVSTMKENVKIFIDKEFIILQKDNLSHIISKKL